MEPRVKPQLRGVFHEAGFYAAVVVAVPLTLSAEPGKPLAAAIVFSVCVALCFGASALYHRPTWTPQVRARLARLDHAGIYLLIAGTYTPFGLLVLSKGWAIPVLTVVYAGAVAAIVTKVCRVRVSKTVSAGIGIALGWVGAVAFTQLAKVGAAGMALVVAGGVFYTAGAAVYALRRPNPKPSVLGYHELFHLCTLAAAACQYVAIAFFVLPRG